ncbi:MAG: magnesium transporter CorA family protein [Candidatus Pacebacteria bacterium]|nr:magnesium transporter CorA family protein [Candidatus Paceibacterota bacterium]
MITYYFRSIKEEALQKIDAIRPGAWVYVENPTEDELDILAESCTLERDLLQDAVDFHEVPRFDSWKGVAYFYTRFPHHHNGEMATAPILLAVTPQVVVTVSREHPAFLNDYLESKTPLYTTKRTKLFLHLIEAINTVYRKKLIGIRKEVQRSRVNLSHIRNSDIVKLITFETTLNDFLSALTPTYTALRTILSGKHLELFEDDQDLMEDIQLENQQIVESAKASHKTIQNIRNSYTAIVTNNLNSVIKLLTSITVIFTIPTIIGALYGMNVPVPFADSPYIFLGIILFTMISMIIAGYIFRRRDWM